MLHHLLGRGFRGFFLIAGLQASEDDCTIPDQSSRVLCCRCGVAGSSVRRGKISLFLERDPMFLAHERENLPRFRESRAISGKTGQKRGTFSLS